MYYCFQILHMKELFVYFLFRGTLFYGILSPKQKNNYAARLAQTQQLLPRLLLIFCFLGQEITRWL